MPTKFYIRHQSNILPCQNQIQNIFWENLWDSYRKLIIKNQKITDLPQIVLNKYIEKFGILKGITIFEETFNLIYILRSADDVLHRTGIQLEELNPININILNNSINDKS